MTQFASRVSPSMRTHKAVPPLENGDQLDRAEFERRWDAMPHLKKAELIDGTVFMAAALSHDFHSAPHFDLIGMLSIYRMSTPGVVGGDNGSVRLDFKNEPQPDIYLMILPTHGGQSKIDADGFVAGAPEFVVEIANTSASYDLHQKLEIYRKHGVKEYIVWRTMDAVIDWMVLENGQYKTVPIPADGILRSVALPGLWLNTTAILRGNWQDVLQSVQQGIASVDHARFSQELKTHLESSKADLKTVKG